jgi:hypothetical protein
MHYQKHRNPWPRRLTLLALGLGVVGAAAYYFVANPEQLPEWAARTEIGQEMQSTRVYKWQDASGAWHVSDTPPPDEAEYSVQEYNRDTNVLPLPPALRD